MNRRDKLLRRIKRDGLGVEIGPSHNPVAPKKDGFRVQIIDHMSRADLLKKYEKHGVELDNIEEVDFIWRGETYAELTGKKACYDWIIASHVVEHTPDLIGFLQSCDEILKEDGVISLAVPDKRYCFDHFRPITGLARIIDSHLQKSRIHSAGAVAEYFLNVVSKNGGIAWSTATQGEYAFVHSLRDAHEGMQAVTTKNAYLDIHAWCFVPHSFRLLMHDLHQLGLTALREVDFLPTEGSEFFVLLGRGGEGPSMSRMEMLQTVERELAQAAHP